MAKRHECSDCTHEKVPIIVLNSDKHYFGVDIEAVPQKMLLYGEPHAKTLGKEFANWLRYNASSEFVEAMDQELLEIALGRYKDWLRDTGAQIARTRTSL